jgi:hypothetical protein
MHPVAFLVFRLLVKGPILLPAAPERTLTYQS